ncbi:MAG: N-acetylglucosamine-6-phosphate deacetylase [Thermotogae bacterium]|nr:MAG: N-acetylglucosamine-6-phosphate deacetylase [Thermotogota bacterium]
MMPPSMSEKKVGPVNLVDPEDGIHLGVVRLKGGFVEEIDLVGEEDPSLPYLLPGFVDPHIHGAVGVDFMSATEKDLERFECFLRSRGVTGCLLTTVSAPVENILKAADTLQSYVHSHPNSVFKGVHVEGPHINPKRRGAHKLEHVQRLHDEEFQNVFSHPMVKLMTLAPELEGFGQAVELAKRYDVILSIGHTEAPFSVITKAVEVGVKRFTHLCNGMPLIHHREVGPVGAAILLENVVAEIIVDGVHLSQEMVRLIHKLMGSRLELVTDAMEAAGLEDGRYKLGRIEVVVNAGIAHLSDDTLAGSTLTMDRAVLLFHKYTGANHSEIVKVSSHNAAFELGCKELGRLREGAPTPVVEIGSQFEYLKVHT